MNKTDFEAFLEERWFDWYQSFRSKEQNERDNDYIKQFYNIKMTNKVNKTFFEERWKKCDIEECSLSMIKQPKNYIEFIECRFLEFTFNHIIFEYLDIKDYIIREITNGITDDTIEYVLRFSFKHKFTDEDFEKLLEIKRYKFGEYNYAGLYVLENIFKNKNNKK